MKATTRSNHLPLAAAKKAVLAILMCAAPLVSTHASAESIIAGKTLLAKGTVNAINPATNDTRTLKRRSKIMSVDNITTGANSKAQFSMADGGLITLKENTEINVSNYVFDKDTQKGSATLEVISGGLRSISGLIKKTGGDYQVKTPVGSIGIRGTHFAVQVVGDNVYFGVYSGNIDIELNNNETLSLGVTEGFAFASVDDMGAVTPLTQAPEALSLGFSTSIPTTTSSSASSSNNTNNVTQATIQTANFSSDTAALASNTSSSPEVIAEPSFTSDIYTELEWEDINTIDIPEEVEPTIAELISQRTGSFNYEQIVESNVSSTVGDISNLSLNMAIDFDNGTVPGGSLSFTDAQGEWFATYSGLIDVDKLDLGVNFASHGNQRADGDISAAFANGLSEITGNFTLHETDDPAVKADGSFKIK
jgi:hypothetical protein